MKNEKYSIIILFMLFVSSCQYDDIIIEECGSTSAPLIDLVVLIDASGSMEEIAFSTSEATKIFNEPLMECPADLRVKFFGVEGIWDGTVFVENHLTYLTSLITQPTLFAANANHIGTKSEQGANAIEDLSNYFDWREGACRSIFYISDEELDSVSPVGDYENEDLVTQQAITAANANLVTVFNHFIDTNNRGSSIKMNYQDLATETNGQHYFSLDDNFDSQFYEGLLPEIICNSCNQCTLNDLIK